jgi:hypothetical protein
MCILLRLSYKFCSSHSEHQHKKYNFRSQTFPFCEDKEQVSEMSSGFLQAVPKYNWKRDIHYWISYPLLASISQS